MLSPARHLTYRARGLRTPTGRRLVVAAAYLAPVPGAALQPAITVQESDARLFATGTNRTQTILQNFQAGQGNSWVVQAYSGYINNIGAYNILNGTGCEILIYSPNGCYALFSGLTNGNGGLFEILVDGVFQRYGNCHSTAEIQQDYHAPIWVPAGLHTLTTVKVSGAHFLDQFSVFV